MNHLREFMLLRDNMLPNPSLHHANSISSLVTDAGWKVQEKLDPDTFAGTALGATKSG